MSPKSSEVLEKLDKIEAEMKRIAFWEDAPVKPVTFEHWLQFTFLPNARAAAAKGKYPEKSQVGLMAMRQYDYHSHVPEAQELLNLLSEFDALIEGR